MSATFNQMFGEAGSSSIEFEGKTLHGRLRINPQKEHQTLIEWYFDSPHPPEEVAIRVKAFRCSFRFPGMDASEEVLGVHGEANRGWVIVDKLGDDPLVTVTNAWMDRTFGGQFIQDLGNHAMLIDEIEPGTFRIRANNASPEDRMAFSDFTGTVKVTTLDEPADYEAGYGVIHPDYPIEHYRYIDTGGEALTPEAYAQMAFVVDDTAEPTKAIDIVGYRWCDVVDIIGHGENFIDMRLDLEEETMSEFGIRDEAKLWGLAAVRLSDGTILEDGTIRYKTP